MGKLDMGFKHVYSQDNVVPSALSYHPDLANVMVVTSGLLDRIQAV